MTQVPPFSATPAVTPEGQVHLVQDATGHILAAAFQPEDSDLIVTQLNRAFPPRNPHDYNPYISAMLAALRLHLEHELGATLTDQPMPIGDLLYDIGNWFGFNMAERALSLGPDTLSYINLETDPEQYLTGLLNPPPAANRETVRIIDDTPVNTLHG